MLCLSLGDFVTENAYGADSPIVSDPLTALRQKDFAGLEKAAATLRTSRERAEDGLWKLTAFYGALSADSKRTSEEYWNVRFGFHEEWLAAFPKSITAHIAYAQALVDYAWSARGTGTADTVKAEAWETFGKRLQEARESLEESEKLSEKCPQWFAVMQSVALGQSWPRKEYEALFRRAVSAEPTYYASYFRKAQYLLPRWHGAQGDWETFAEEAAAKDDPSEGMAIYTRIAWANSVFYGNLFQESRIDWEKMKQGFRDIEKAYPNSQKNLNAFCRFASEALDLKTTAELLAKIGNEPMRAVWPPGSFEKARRLTDLEAKPADEATVLVLPGNTNHAQRVTFSPDGKSVAVAYAKGSAVIWNIASKKAEWTIDDFGAAVSSVVFSPDSKLLAVSSGLGGKNEKGTVKVYDTQSGKVHAEIGDWLGVVGRIDFTPDGKTLVMVGGDFRAKSQGQLWDVATGNVQPLGWKTPHHHHLESLAISPDSKLMAVECGHAINVWSLVDRKFVFFTQQTDMKEYVWGTAFSPDGKLLAAAAGPEFRQDSRHLPGRLVLWETDGWKLRSPGISTRMGGLSSVAFSPDSRLIAAGDYDQCVRIWEIATGKEIATFNGHEAVVRSVVFSPNGESIASSSGDGTVRIWKVPR